MQRFLGWVLFSGLAMARVATADETVVDTLAIAGRDNVVSGTCSVVVGGVSNAAGVVSSVFPDYSGYDAILGGGFNLAGGGGSGVFAGWGNSATGFADGADIVRGGCYTFDRGRSRAADTLVGGNADTDRMN